LKRFGNDLGKKGFKADIEKELLKAFEDAADDDAVLSGGSGRSSERRREKGRGSKKGKSPRRPHLSDKKLQEGS